MGRPDAAGGEDVGVARAQRVERLDDLRLVVGDHAHFLEIDADGGEIVGDEADVLVLGAARQDLVADDKDRRGDDLRLCAHGGHRVLGGPNMIPKSGNRFSDKIMLKRIEHLAWPRQPLKARPTLAAALAPSR